MNEKQLTRFQERLIDARREALNNHQSTGMRPHGKLWGMDVFSWINPDLTVLSNTIHAFPFPVIWLGNYNDIAMAIHEDESLMSNVRSVILHDASAFSLKDEWLEGIRNCAGSMSVEDGFHMLKTVKAPQSVLLFTASGDNWEENKMQFEEILKLLQLG